MSGGSPPSSGTRRRCCSGPAHRHPGVPYRRHPSRPRGARRLRHLRARRGRLGGRATRLTWVAHHPRRAGGDPHHPRGALPRNDPDPPLVVGPPRCSTATLRTAWCVTCSTTPSSRATRSSPWAPTSPLSRGRSLPVLCGAGCLARLVRLLPRRGRTAFPNLLFLSFATLTSVGLIDVIPVLPTPARSRWSSRWPGCCTSR